jgi:hypothetical protein
MALRKLKPIEERDPYAAAVLNAFDLLEEQSQKSKCEALLRRAMRQLELWQEKYGEHQPAWLPPAGDIRLAEDVTELLTPNVRSHRRCAASSRSVQ